MPKKPSDFLNKKRSRGNGDFARPKAKVGRKVKRRAGETDASFQTRQLSITEQSVAKDRAGAKVSRRGLTLDEHLGQLAHHSAKQRTAACDGAREITTAHGDEAWRCFAPLLDGAARLINDDDGATRRAASKLIRDAILPTAYGPGDAVADEQARQAAIVAAAPLFAARLGAALSSFDAGCRKEACGVLEALIKNAPDACRRKLAAAASKTLRAPLVNAVRVAGPPKDHEADAYRASLLRCCASVFLEGSPGPFSLAPEADVLEGDDRADGSAVTLYRGVAAADEAAQLPDESTDDGFGKRCAELAGDAVRRATAERATKGAVLRALEELEPLACLARRGRAAFHARARARAGRAPARAGGRAARRGPPRRGGGVARGLRARRGPEKRAEARRGAGAGLGRRPRSLARRVLLKRDTKAAANMLRGRGWTGPISSQGRARAGERRPAPRGARRRLGPRAAGRVVRGARVERGAGRQYRRRRLFAGRLVDVARRCHQSTRPWRRTSRPSCPTNGAGRGPARCWHISGRCLPRVRAACATVSADARHPSVTRALKRGAPSTTRPRCCWRRRRRAHGRRARGGARCRDSFVIFTASAAASSAEPRPGGPRAARGDRGDAAAARDVAKRRRLARAEIWWRGSPCPSSRRTTRARPSPPRVSGASPPPSAIRRRRRAAASRLTRSRRGLLCERRVVTSCNAPARGRTRRSSRGVRY